MEYRRLGRSELRVSAVGFGTCQLRLLPEQQAIDTLLASFDLGVNIVHTGPDYGPAEEWVARAMALTDRKVIVAYHAADAPSEGRGPVPNFEAQFEAACARYGGDRLDLFGIACIDDREAFKENVWGRHGMVEFLQRKKRQGRLGATFCTTHGAPEYVARLVTSGAFDAVMIAYNVLGYHLLSCYPTPGRHFESIERNKQEIFPLCRQHDVGLMIMKPLAGGLLCDSRAFPPRRESGGLVVRSRARELLRSILLNPEVSCVVPGTNSVEEAEENALSGEGPIVVDDPARHGVRAVVDELRHTVCSRCGKCEPLCSQNLPVSWLFRAALINLQPSAQHEVLEHVDYFRLNSSLEAPCASCTNRTCICPDDIDIPASLSTLHQQMLDLTMRGLIPGPTPGEPSVRVPRADTTTIVSDRQPPPMTMIGPSLAELSEERDELRAELTAVQRQLSTTTDRLRALDHVVESIRASRGYRLLRRLGRWRGVEATLAALSVRTWSGGASEACEGAGHARAPAPTPGATSPHTAADTLAVLMSPNAEADADVITPLHDWNLNPVVHPLEAAHGYAGHLVDLHGSDFVDFSAAWGANLLGYGYARVAEAVAAQGRRYAGVGMPCPELRELERLLNQVIPGAELIRFGKNGSDATMGAIRLARAVTGRDLVLHRGYHGFHDWWMASTDCQGIPSALRALIEPVHAFTPENVELAFERHPGAVACIIFDPMFPPTPSAAAVRAIIETAHRHGALAIVDEVVSGFRVAPGGMQEVWGVQADLACHGKGVANGLPLSVLSGKAVYMQRLEDVRYGMTFEAEAVSLAAALATVREVLEKDVCRALTDKGRYLTHEYERLATHYGMATRLGGPLARPHLTVESQAGIAERELRWLFIQELSRAGVLTVGVFNLCFSHDEEDLRLTVGAFERAMSALRRARDQGSVEGLLDPRILEGIRLTERVQ